MSSLPHFPGVICELCLSHSPEEASFLSVERLFHKNSEVLSANKCTLNGQVKFRVWIGVDGTST